MNTYYLIGHREALKMYKVAGILDDIRTSLSPANIKRTFIGDPHTALRQLDAGTGFSPGGVFHQAMHPTTAMGKAFTWGLPALGVGLSLMSDPSVRGTAVGSSIGGSVGSILGAPFGAVGTIGGTALGGALGSVLGRPFNADPPPRRLEEEKPQVDSLRGTTTLPYTNEVGAVPAP
jgi:hypothetical protein